MGPQPHRNFKNLMCDLPNILNFNLYNAYHGLHPQVVGGGQRLTVVGLSSIVFAWWCPGRRFPLHPR